MLNAIYFQQYIVCKDFKSHRCLTFQTELNHEVNSVRDLYSDTKLPDNCYISNTKPQPGLKQTITVILTVLLFYSKD